MADGMLAAMVKALRNVGRRGDDDQRAAEAKQASEEMAKRMPDTVMPHRALQAQKQREDMLEQLARESR